MAKKKSKSKKAEKAEPVKKAQKKKTNTAGWVIGAIIVIVIIIAIILLLKGCAKQTPTTPTTPTTPAAPATTEKAPAEQAMATSEAPAEIRYCTIQYAIGWPKNKLGTDVCKIDGNKVEAQIMYSGKGDSLAGLWFKILTADGKVQYFKDTRVIKANETKTYTVDVGQKIEDMTAYPISGDKSCLNQRLLVIKAESCVAG